MKMVDVLINPIPPSPSSEIPITFVEIHDGGDISTEENEDPEKLQYEEDQDVDSKSDHRWLSPPPRTKTRLLSRSHSVSDLGSEDTLKPELEPLRRNSSGEYNQQYMALAPLSPAGKTAADNAQQNMISSSNNKLFEHVMTTESKSPSPAPITAPNTHLSPINFQVHQSHQNWKAPKAVPAQEDTFTLLLQTTAERVLNKLKSRQQDLGKNMQTGRKVRKQQHGMHQQVPRKLQPILRDGVKTPLVRSESNLSDRKGGDSDTASIFSST